MSSSPPALPESDTVFHGTTAGRAARIQAHGFEAPSIDKDLRRLADLHGVDFAALRGLVESESPVGYGHNQDRRGSGYFAASKETAASYASRGPEYLYHGLSFIYRLLHPDLEEEGERAWWHIDRLNWWVLRQRFDDPPVVMTVSFPEGTIPSLFKYTMPQEDAESLRQQGLYGPVDIPLELPLTNAINESVEPVPLRIDLPMARFILQYPEPAMGQTDPFAAAAEAGTFGPVYTQHGNHAYWEWDDFKNRIPAERLNELMTSETS